MVSIASRAIPSRSIPINEDAPQSIRKFARRPTTWKQVLSRPPEPNASPLPTNRRCMRSGPAALGKAHQEPDRHHDDGPEQEVAPQPYDGVPAHVPDAQDQVVDAVPDVARVEAECRQDDADQDRQENDAQQ